MLDHIGIRVSDYERSKRFFEVALERLGYRLHKRDAEPVDFGTTRSSYE